MKQLVIILFSVCLLFLLLIPTACSQHIPLNDSQVAIIADDQVGFLNGGKDIIKINLSDTSFGQQYIDIFFTLGVFNTKDVSVKYDIFLSYPTQADEREYTSIQLNYTFISIPKLDWITLEKSSLRVFPDYQYRQEVQVRLPIAELDKCRTDNEGFLFYINVKPSVESGSVIFLQPYRRVFLQIEGTFVPVQIPSYVYFVTLALIASLVISYIVIKRRGNTKQINDTSDIFNF